MKAKKNATPASSTAAALRDLPPGSKLTQAGTTTVAPAIQTAPSAPAITLPPAPPLPPQPLLPVGNELAPHHFPRAAAPGAAGAPQPGRKHLPTFDEPLAHITSWREHARNLRRSLGGMLRSLEQGVPVAEHLVKMAEENAEMAEVFAMEGIDLQVAKKFLQDASTVVNAFAPRETAPAPAEPSPAAA